MWPWEHLAVGYLLYSLGARALGRSPLSDGGAVALAFATQLPDLVDKPLSWGLGWFPSGYALGHSALVGLPASLLLVVAARRHDWGRFAAPFLVGYWAHLAADVLNPLRSGDPAAFVRVLWPVADVAPYETDYGLGRGLVYVDRYLATLSTMDPASVAVVLLVPAAAVALWVLDGAPGVGLLTRAVGGARRQLR
jgi:hypothetical protein